MELSRRPRALAIALCLAGLVACTAPTAIEPARLPALQDQEPRSVSPSAQSFRINAAASTLHVLVYRGGRLGRLGHNHVISSDSIQGSLWRGPSLQDSGFTIAVPVNTLIVDDDNARAAEGEDFPLNVTDEAKQGTKTNMLRETLLDGAHYPEISIVCLGLQGDTEAPIALAALRIKDQTRQVSVPVRVSSIDGRLHVKGAFNIQQTDFGITPLNIGLGALLVLDTIQIKFELVADADLP